MPGFISRPRTYTKLAEEREGRRRKKKKLIWASWATQRCSPPAATTAAMKGKSRIPINQSINKQNTYTYTHTIRKKNRVSSPESS